MSDALAADRPLRWAAVFSVLFALGGLLPEVRIFASPEHYLALHTALEFFSISVSAMVFALGWNLRHTDGGGRLVWLGSVFLAVGLVDFFHTLSYAGMPVFVTPSGAEKAIAFWLAGRLLAVFGLLALLFVPDRRCSTRGAVVAACAALAIVALCGWLVLFRPELLPRTHVAGEGLTPFKIVAEYVLAGLYVLAAVLLYRRGRRRQDESLRWLATAAWVLALGGLCFTLYVEVADLFNVLGHLYKLAAYVLIYRALFVSGVREPHAVLAREQALLRALIDSVPDFISFKDTRGAYLGCNRAFAECYGVDEEALRGRTDAEVFGRGGHDLAPAPASSPVVTTQRHEEWVEAPDGSLRLLDTLRIPFMGADGEYLGEIGISRDFTERRRIREQIAERERRLMMALEGASLGLWDWDVPSGRMVFSPLWGRMLGYGLDELPPDVTTWEAMVHPDDWRDIRAALEPHLRGETESYSAEYRLRHKAGHWVWVQDAGRVLERGDDGAPLRAVGIHQDITQRKAMEESLLQLATSDPLTGLWNRRHFTEMVNGELGRVRRRQSEAALLLLDLDFFKRINDTRGHAAGDEVLRHFVGLVSASLREADVFARLGGEEFAILLPCIDAAGAMLVAERLRGLVDDSPAQADGEPIAFSVSIGVSMLAADDASFDAVFARADEALYAAKHAGRNCARMVEKAAAEMTAAEKATGPAPEVAEPVGEGEAAELAAAGAQR